MIEFVVFGKISSWANL